VWLCRGARLRAASRIAAHSCSRQQRCIRPATMLASTALLRGFGSTSSSSRVVDGRGERGCVANSPLPEGTASALLCRCLHLRGAWSAHLSRAQMPRGGDESRSVGEAYGKLMDGAEKVPDSIDTVWKAAAYGDTDALKELLEADAAAANLADPSGYRPLHVRDAPSTRASESRTRPWAGKRFYMLKAVPRLAALVEGQQLQRWMWLALVPPPSNGTKICESG
jgi:hypothetical protein